MVHFLLFGKITIKEMEYITPDIVTNIVIVFGKKRVKI